MRKPIVKIDNHKQWLDGLRAFKRFGYIRINFIFTTDNVVAGSDDSMLFVVWTELEAKNGFSCSAEIDHVIKSTPAKPFKIYLDDGALLVSVEGVGYTPIKIDDPVKLKPIKAALVNPVTTITKEFAAQVKNCISVFRCVDTKDWLKHDEVYCRFAFDQRDQMAVNMESPYSFISYDEAFGLLKKTGTFTLPVGQAEALMSLAPVSVFDSGFYYGSGNGFNVVYDPTPVLKKFNMTRKSIDVELGVAISKETFLSAVDMIKNDLIYLKSHTEKGKGSLGIVRIGRQALAPKVGKKNEVKIPVLSRKLSTKQEPLDVVLSVDMLKRVLKAVSYDRVFLAGVEKKVLISSPDVKFVALISGVSGEENEDSEGPEED